AAKRAHAGGVGRFAARAVSGDVVVHTKTGFATVSFERGTVASVSGQQLTITEGTAKASYKTVTLTIPVNARVRDDRQKATLSDVKAGQRVLVLTGPKQTAVIARSARAAYPALPHRGAAAARRLKAVGIVRPRSRRPSTG